MDLLIQDKEPSQRWRVCRKPGLLLTMLHLRYCSGVEENSSDLTKRRKNRKMRRRTTFGTQANGRECKRMEKEQEKEREGEWRERGRKRKRERENGGREGEGW